MYENLKIAWPIGVYFIISFIYLIFIVCTYSCFILFNYISFHYANIYDV